MVKPAIGGWRCQGLSGGARDLEIIPRPPPSSWRRTGAKRQVGQAEPAPQRSPALFVPSSHCPGAASRPARKPCAAAKPCRHPVLTPLAGQCTTAARQRMTRIGDTSISTPSHTLQRRQTPMRHSKQQWESARSTVKLLKLSRYHCRNLVNWRFHFHEIFKARSIAKTPIEKPEALTRFIMPQNSSCRCSARISGTRRSFR